MAADPETAGGEQLGHLGAAAMRADDLLVGGGNLQKFEGAAAGAAGVFKQGHGRLRFRSALTGEGVLCRTGWLRVQIKERERVCQLKNNRTPAGTNRQ